MAHRPTSGTVTERRTTYWMRPHVELQNAVASGAVAGLIAGLAMAMVAMIRAWAVGMGFWLPPKLIAATFYGVDALVGGTAVIIVGLMLHMMMSAAFGAVFSLIVGSRLSAAAALGAGLVYGAAVWAMMTFIGLPLVNQVMGDRMALQPVWRFVYHLIFGSVLFLTPLLARAFSTSRLART